MTDRQMKDSAGNERTEEQVRKMAKDTLSQMSTYEVLDLLGPSPSWWPDELTQCDCHGLWYDECEAYR